MIKYSDSEQNLIVLLEEIVKNKDMVHKRYQNPAFPARTEKNAYLFPAFPAKYEKTPVFPAIVRTLTTGVQENLKNEIK